MKLSLNALAHRSGFTIHKYVAAGLSLVVMAGVLAAAFNQCGYTTRSDASMYFGQMLKIREDYWSRNLEALRFSGPRAEAPEHVVLGTEAGYGFLLYLVDKTLGYRAVFHANSVLLPLMIVALAWCVFTAAGRGRRGWLAALLLLWLLLTPRIARREMMLLADLLRDPPSHLLAFLCLAAAISTVRDTRRVLFPSVAMGLAIGLSACFRMTGILFAVPVGLYLLLAPRSRPVRRRIVSCVCLGLGMLLGLVPLLGQNILEGKSLLETGQISDLADVGQVVGQEPGNGSGDEDNADDSQLSEDNSAETKAGGEEAGEGTSGDAAADRKDRLAAARKADKLPKGFHPMYFRIWFPQMVRRVFGAFGPRNAFTVLFGVLLGLLLAGRPALLLLGTALVFTVFYSFYDKILWRYLYLGSMLAAAAASLGLAAAADIAIGFSGRRIVRIGLSAAMVLAALALILTPLYDEGRDVFELPSRWNKMQEVERELERDFRPDDLFITYDQSFSRWIEYMARGGDSVTKVAVKEKRAGRMARFREILNTGERRVIFLSRLQDDMREQPSWWKDDLLNEFDMEPMGARFRDKFFCWRLQPRSMLRREVPLAASDPADRHVFLFARRLSATNRWQSVLICSAGDTNGVSASIQTGPNLLPLPAGVDAARPAVTLISGEPLPSFVRAETVGTGPARMLWCSYEHMPTLSFAADKALEVRWFGYKRWKRDWGGYDRKHMSYPLWQMPPGSRIRMPVCNSEIGVRLYFTAQQFDEFSAAAEASLPRELRLIRYRIGETELVPRLVLMRPIQKRREWRSVEFVHEVAIPAGRLRDVADPKLEIRYNGLRDWDLLLYQTEFLLGRNVTPAETGPQTGGPEPIAYAWREEDDRSVWGAEGWLDKAFRVLDRPVSVPVNVLRRETAAGAVLLVYWPARSAAKCRVTFEAGDRSGSFKVAPSSRPTPHYVALGTTATDSLRLTPAFDSKPTCLPVINCVWPVQTIEPDRPFVIGMAAEDRFMMLAEGFWWPEPQPDGAVMRWTRAAATVRFPLARADRDLQLTVALQGPPKKVGELPLTLRVNDTVVGTADVSPEEKQEVVFRVQADCLREGMNAMEVRTHGWRPSDIMKSEDSRELGVWIRSLEWADGESVEISSQ